MKRVTAIILALIGVLICGASSPGAQKSKPVSLYDVCVQEDGGGAPVWLQLNSTTGEYRLQNCEDGFALAGYSNVAMFGDLLTCQWTNGDYEGSFEITADSATGIVRDVLEDENVIKVTDNTFKDNDCTCN